MPPVSNRTGNRILDRLSANESEVLLSAGQIASLPGGQVIYRQDGPMPHVYFPTTGLIGVVVVVEDGQQIEGTTVGNEGMVGLPVFLGVDFHPFRVVSQVPGEAVQVPASAFLRAIKSGGTLDRVIRQYTLYRMRCANQTGVCNALHLVEERMSRWLLMAHDGAGKDESLLTHEFLSELLGVRRQTVSITAGALQRSGLITYRRGTLRILDREGLEAASCECYDVMKQLYRRIME